MSASPELPVISCPSGLVAVCAPMLGYQPRRSIVGFINGVPGRPGAVVVRADLVTGGCAATAAARLAESIAGTQGTSIDLVAWVDDPSVIPRSELSSGPMLAELVGALAERGIRVRTTLSTEGSVWWTHDCPRAGCCESALPLDASVVDEVRAEFAYAGYAPLASREELAERLAPDPARADRVHRLLEGAREPADLERWRDAQVVFLTALLVPGAEGVAGPRTMGVLARRDPAPVTPQLAVRALRGLDDVAVRDTVLLRLITCEEPQREQWHRSIDLLSDLVRCAPSGRGAPAATLLGIVAWMRGEGAMATLALDRAQADDARYRLAALAREVIARGIDPEQWRRGMAGLTEAECRRAGRPTRRLGGPRPRRPSAPTR
jgi:hypothetical protein